MLQGAAAAPGPRCFRPAVGAAPQAVLLPLATMGAPFLARLPDLLQHRCIPLNLLCHELQELGADHVDALVLGAAGEHGSL
eukprot:10138098-Lingulodinium_polyedra.AAC.1